MGGKKNISWGRWGRKRGNQTLPLWEESEGKYLKTDIRKERGGTGFYMTKDMSTQNNLSQETLGGFHSTFSPRGGVKTASAGKGE